MARPPFPWPTLDTGAYFELNQAVEAMRLLTIRLSFAEKLLKAVKGAKGLVEPSYVYLPGVPGGKEIAEKTGLEFFSTPIELGVS